MSKSVKSKTTTAPIPKKPANINISDSGNIINQTENKKILDRCQKLISSKNLKNIEDAFRQLSEMCNKDA